MNFLDTVPNKQKFYIFAQNVTKRVKHWNLLIYWTICDHFKEHFLKYTTYVSSKSLLDTEPLLIAYTTLIHEKLEKLTKSEYKRRTFSTFLGHSEVFFPYGELQKKLSLEGLLRR